MRKITLQDISRLNTASGDLYLEKGQLLYSKGDPLPNNCADILERSGVLHLCQVKPEERTNFLFSAEYKSINLENKEIFQEEGKLQRTLYDKEGNMVIGAGTVLSMGIIESLRRQNKTVLYIRRSKTAVQKDEASAKELKRRLNELDHDSFRSAIVKSLDSNFEEVNHSFFNPEMIDDVEGKYKNSFAPDLANSLSKSLQDRDLTVLRSDMDKQSIKNFYDNAVLNLKSILYGISMKHITDSTGLLEIAKNIVDILLKDKEILMNSIFLDEEYVSDFVITHSIKTTVVSANIALAMGFSGQQIFELAVGSLIHDIGMLRVPQEILNKKTPLTAAEKNEIFRHPVYSLDILEKLRNIPVTTPLVAYHVHERGDRSGYPKGRNLSTINVNARIIAIADIYCAMISKRSYRDAYTPYSVVEYLTREAISGRIDSKIFKSFLRINALYPLGSWVSLTDGTVGKVIGADSELYDRPVIRVFFKNNKRVVDGEAVKLADHPEIKVAKAFAGSKLKIDVMEGF